MSAIEYFALSPQLIKYRYLFNKFYNRMYYNMLFLFRKINFFAYIIISKWNIMINIVIKHIV
ncbi:hypothetical protein BFX80_04550 [Cobetia marina]|nr:hypothetical protein BFX80_04550 [Cobetia marina]